MERIYIEKYRCLTGEIVKVENFNEDDPYIFIHYKGKRYRRDKNIIGVKLLPIVTIDKTVEIRNCSTGEILTVRFCGISAEKLYKRMGGSYYGNSVKITYVGDNINISNEILMISAVSPLGKCLMNKSTGDELTVPLPNNNFEKYNIIKIYKD